MIHELRIRALGVIDEAVIPFAAGFTVLTGETGAGKTMVLTGLGLIRGDKADAGTRPSRVRAGGRRRRVATPGGGRRRVGRRGARPARGGRRLLRARG